MTSVNASLPERALDEIAIQFIYSTTESYPADVLFSMIICLIVLSNELQSKWKSTFIVSMGKL